MNSHNPTGSGWISIGGEMVMLSVGPNDQVRLNTSLWLKSVYFIVFSFKKYKNVFFGLLNKACFKKS